ncbi:uncharacterized protein LOC119990431 isoform X2 [Tripterygium wilfordii]|uniref:uncharacterized protein LOC119990431 isoform X2 n=1 Tax=Tripterygium wilfordii TaxID=458696 RepID=UPI0018F7E886|nr:uncharacterized protein LOC119990431 isoform X2 [Tripterygium wilfordii]XP_038692268.1 uncharacterized protein LOC119990431 isoform X2 [Tripterygium wilfordii]
MGESKDTGIHKSTKNGGAKAFDPAFRTFFVQLPHKFQNSLLNKLIKGGEEANSTSSDLRKERELCGAYKIDLEKQLQAWKENPSWVDQPPEIKVTVPKGSLSLLNVKVNVGLPPDEVYNIVTNPDNKRIFKNIKEVVSRKVLIDEGLRQVVELEQAALWKFLWWSGTISVHLLVDQNRQDHSMKFKQIKTGFMKKFEGCWRVGPAFVDEKMCLPFKPKTLADYYSCTGGKGRIGSNVILEQLIQPAIVPPPPISWYLRGITTKTTEMIIHDLLIEAARIRGGFNAANSGEHHAFQGQFDEDPVNRSRDIKERWALRRRISKQKITRQSAE